MSYCRLLNCLWRAGHLAGREFAGSMGETIVVVSPGEPSDEAGVWNSAEIVVDGERRRGEVAIGEETVVPDAAVFRLTTRDVSPVLGFDDWLVTQAHYSIEPEIIECYDALRAGAAVSACASRIVSMPSQLHRTSLFTGLLVERLRRKSARIDAIFDETQHDWNQTFHVLLLQAMGGDRNREVFTRLATRVTSAMVSREKSSQASIEALLLGGAGFLHQIADKDDYTQHLTEEFRHLAAKYSIVPLRPAEWNLSKLYPANHPAVRLAEIAALLSKKDFMLDGMLACRTSEDVERLMSVTASDYWRTHYKPSGEPSTPSAKTIGRAKARLVGINLAAPLMFAYGKQTGAEELCERALDLLATIPAEKNRKLEGWYSGGCTPENGFDSQALLELTNEYCTAATPACADCPLGRAEIKNLISFKAYKG